MKLVLKIKHTTLKAHVCSSPSSLQKKKNMKIKLGGMYFDFFVPLFMHQNQNLGLNNTFSAQ